MKLYYMLSAHKNGRIVMMRRYKTQVSMTINWLFLAVFWHRSAVFTFSKVLD